MSVYELAVRAPADSNEVTYSVIVGHNDYWADLLLERLYLQFPELASKVRE